MRPHHRSEEAARGREAEGEVIPVELYPHQITGVEWLASRKRALLADEMGLGKSPTAIVAAKRAGCERILVIAPTVVMWNWAREIQRWAPGEHVRTFKHGNSSVGPKWTVITHGQIIREGTNKKLDAERFDLVILDESHLFRNASAQRTRAFYGTGGIIHHTDRVWLLTGTPMPNHAAELWPMLRGLWPERCPFGFEAFRKEFCQLEWSPFQNDWKVVGNRNVAKLKQMLDGIVLRRLKRDHLNLPPVRWETTVLPAAGSSPELRNLEQFFQAHGPKGEALLEWLRVNSAFAAWRRMCGLAKIEPTLDLLQMEQDGTTHKTVVFAHHLDVLRGLEKGLGEDNVVTITGEVSAHERTQRVALFQEDPMVRVALCQITAGGVGITLTAATEVVFVEASFTPGDNKQAADRCHRIGQTLPVRVRFLSLAGTVDELTAEILARKSSAIAEVFSEKS